MDGRNLLLPEKKDGDAYLKAINAVFDM